MAIAPDFRVVSQEYNKQAFQNRFSTLRKADFEERGRPSRDDDQLLLTLFQTAYPNHDTYIQSEFAEAIALAETLGVKISLPQSDILDVQKEPFAGMGQSFYLRLLYLQNLVTKTISEVEEKIQLAKPPTLPSLQLIMASDIFNAIRIESSNQVMRNAPTEPTGFMAGLKSRLNGASQQGLHSGYVIKSDVASLTSGGARKTLTIILQDNETGAKPMKLVMDGKDTQDVKNGDLIGAVGVKKSSDGSFSASHMAILVPVKITAFLRRAEPDFTPIPSTVREMIVTSDDPNNPDFKLGDVLSNESQGTLIFGRVMSVDERARTITIKDKDNRPNTVRIDQPFDNFHLEQGNMFIARATQLGKDGLYKITPKETMKMEAPYAGRLLFALPKIAPKREESEGLIDFEATAPMPH